MADDPLKLARMEMARRELAARQQQTAPTPATDMRAWMDQQSQGLMDESARGERTAASWLNRAGESMTLGLVGDEAAAAADALIGRGNGYDERLQHYRQQEEDLGTAGRLSADVAGAFVPGAGMVAGLAGAVSKGGALARGAMMGAGSGGLYSFMEGEGGADQRIQSGMWGAGLGAGVGAVGSALGGLLQRSLDKRATRQAIKGAARNAPTSEQLRAQGNALYRQVDDAGVQIRPEAFGRMREETIDALRNNTGFDELPGPGSLTPNSSRVMEIMRQADDTLQGTPTAALPFKSLDQMRRQAGAAAGNVANKADQRAGVEVIQQLDDFVQRLGPDDVAGGNVEALKTAIPKAREVWSRMTKSQLLDDAMERSENYLSGSASGVRNQFKNILQNKKLAARFTPAEREALRMVTHGSTLDQMINLAGGGLAQMASVGGGLAAGGPLGGLIGMGAAAAQRKLAEGVTMRNAEMVRAAVASGKLPEAVAASPALANLLRMQLLGQAGQIGGTVNPALPAR